LWLSEVGRTSCKVCIAYYGENTPCDTCRPELKDVNVPYFVLYNYCQDQVIMGPSGPVSLDGHFIRQGMEDYQIDKDEHIEFSLAVRRIAGIIYNAQAEEAEKKRKKK